MRALVLVLLATGCTSDHAVTAEQLGSEVFVDTSLSRPGGQACADCHAPDRAFRDPESDRSTSAGATNGFFGPRNSPTIMYAAHVPPLHHDGTQWIGGLFWDGRASSLEEQASMPLLNPIEMGNPDKASVVGDVRAAAYAHGFRDLYGANALADTDHGFANVTAAVAAYERSPALSPFSSKYDHYLAGTASLTEHEQRGLAIFEDPARGNCASCHPSRPGPDGSPPMFTNFSYANLGIPTYRNSKFFRMPPDLNPDGDSYIDHGLMTTVGDPAQDGKFRVPTLRNITRTAPYGHNGYFENLPYMLDFLNTRDTWSPHNGAWQGPEVPATVDHRVGHLGLTQVDLEDLFAFLGTLTDQ